MHKANPATTHVGQQSGHPACRNLEELVNSALASRRKVFLMSFELRFPRDMTMPSDNGALKRFHKSLNTKFGPKGLALAPIHYWLRKQESRTAHYRCAILLNGDRLGSVYGAQVIVQEMWNLALGLDRSTNYGLVSHGFVGLDGVRRECGVMLRADDHLCEDKLKDCLAWMS